MEFLDALRRKKQDQATTTFQQYAALIMKAADSADGSLAPADQSKIEKLAETLGRGIEQMEADVSAIRSIRERENASADLEQHRLAMVDAWNATRTHDAETRRLQEQHDAMLKTRAAELASLQSARYGAEFTHAESLKAFNTVSLLRARHWRILGMSEAPEVVRRDFSFSSGEHHDNPTTEAELRRQSERRSQQMAQGHSPPEMYLPDVSLLPEDEPAEAM